MTIYEETFPNSPLLAKFDPDEPIPVRNVPLLRKVLEHIEAHPEEHDQTQWISLCGTQACFAGWTLLLAGHDFKAIADTDPDDGDEYVLLQVDNGQPQMHDGEVVETARKELGLTSREAFRLFWGSNTAGELRMLAEEFAGEKL